MTIALAARRRCRHLPYAEREVVTTLAGFWAAADRALSVGSSLAYPGFAGIPCSDGDSVRAMVARAARVATRGHGRPRRPAPRGPRRGRPVREVDLQHRARRECRLVLGARLGDPPRACCLVDSRFEPAALVSRKHLLHDRFVQR